MQFLPRMILAQLNPLKKKCIYYNLFYRIIIIVYRAPILNTILPRRGFTVKKIYRINLVWPSTLYLICLKLNQAKFEFPFFICSKHGILVKKYRYKILLAWYIFYITIHIKLLSYISVEWITSFIFLFDRISNSK